jgi:hypothetical protein
MRKPLLLPPSRLVSSMLGLFLALAAGLAVGVLAFKLTHEQPPTVPAPPPDARLSTCGPFSEGCTAAYESALDAHALLAYYDQAFYEAGWRGLGYGGTCDGTARAWYGYDREPLPEHRDPAQHHEAQIVIYRLPKGAYHVSLNVYRYPAQRPIIDMAIDC